VMNNRSPVLKHAEIMPEVLRYHLWGIVIFSIVSVVGIVLLPLSWPLSRYFIQRYYDRLEVVLTRRDLKVRRGILNTEEKSIPLEKITDLALSQGPIMRLFNLKAMRVETAGQSSQGALVTVVGIADVEAFRDAVLDQRDRVSDRDEEALPTDSAQSGASNVATGQTEALLADIRDSLQRIEKLVGQNGRQQ
jgi:putative membrane protein